MGRLRRGEVEGRKKWTPRSGNYLLYLTTAVLDDQVAQGNVLRNIARLVDRVAGDPKKFRTLTDAEMFRILDHECRDRHLWALALCGLRRGELAGPRWEHVDLTARPSASLRTESFSASNASNRARLRARHHAAPSLCPTMWSRCSRLLVKGSGKSA